MTNKRGPVKLFTFSFEIDAPNIISCTPKIFSCAPKNVHLVAHVLPNSNLNFEPFGMYSTEYYTLSFTHWEGEGQPSNNLWLKRVCLIYHFKHCYGFHCMFWYMYGVLSILHVSRVCLACLRFIHQKQWVSSTCVFVGLML